MDIHARADRLALLMEEKLDLRGRGFPAKVRRAGRLIPRALRRDAAAIVKALDLGEHPKLVRQVDFREIGQAADRIEAWLSGIDPWKRRWGIALDWLAGNAANILILAALVLLVLVWRGFL